MYVLPRLDKEITKRGLCQTRSQAENYIRLGLVSVDGRVVKKPGFFVDEHSSVSILGDQYVSRAALKLASIADQFGLDFREKTVLDVGSSTGGFTDYALQHGAKKVIAVDVGTDQLHPSLHGDARIELHEKTDIREWASGRGTSKREELDFILADVSFISLTKILPSLSTLASSNTRLLMMCKPQFEAEKSQVNKGVIKTSKMRRDILKNFENWLKQNNVIIIDKADSQVAGTKGNVERFYNLRIARG